MLDFKLALELEPEAEIQALNLIILNLTDVPAFLVVETLILQAVREIGQTREGVLYTDGKMLPPLGTWFLGCWGGLWRGKRACGVAHASGSAARGKIHRCAT